MTDDRVDLEQENRLLHEENARLAIRLKEFQDFDSLNSRLFLALSTRLQVHSTSIKAAVSSLLDRSIFWDVSAQQEFLEAISASINDISNLMTSVVLATMLQSENLEITRTSYELHELMTAVSDRVQQLSGQSPMFSDHLAQGSLVQVDYRYFVHALATLISVVGCGEGNPVILSVTPDQYLLTIPSISRPVSAVIEDILGKQWSPRMMRNGVPAEKVFDLLLAIRLLLFQQIQCTYDQLQPGLLVIGIPVNA